MSTNVCQLGCGTYRVFVTGRGVTDSLTAELPWQEVRWTRRLDETSDAVVETSGPAAGCCPDGSAGCFDGVVDIRPWTHDLVVVRDRVRVWSGPVIDLEATEDGIRITARDHSAWWWRRWLPNDYHYVGVDLGTVFADYVNDAMAVDQASITYREGYAGAVSATCPTVTTGIKGERKVYDEEHRILGDELDEITRTAVDWTCSLGVVTLSPVELVAAPIVLTDGHFARTPLPKLSGMDVATRVAVIGNEPTVNGTASMVAPAFGVLDSTYSEGAILDAASAARNAATRLERKRPILADGSENLQAHIDDGVLAPGAPLTVEQLLPGIHVRLVLSATCIPVNGVYRLHGVDSVASVDGDGEDERVTVRLQPVGTEA